MKEIKMYYCKDSKTHMVDFGDSSVQCRCDGMELLEPNTVEASVEKHVPVIDSAGGKLHVQVGSLLHPMQPDHYIEWIFVQTQQGGMYCKLTTGQKPQADFPVELADVVGVYAYCNLHGFWKGDINSESDTQFHEIVCSAEFPDCIES